MSEIARIIDQTKEFCVANNISDDKYHDIALILDELVTNIVKYAYVDGKEHLFSINLDLDQDRVIVTITDDGVAFNPLFRTSPDINSPLENRQIGGLGIFIVKQLSSTIAYSRIGEKNQLRITVLVGEEKDHGH